MLLVPKFRFRCALVFGALLLVAPRVQAEEVTHQFTGVLTTVTNGSGITADLTGLFSLGQAVMFQYTIERNATGVPQGPNVTGYQDAITEFSFSIDTFEGAGVPAYSLTTVTNNAPYDQYSAQVQGGITTPPLGNTTMQSLTYTLDDVQGTVFGSQAIPREFPELSVFEGKTFTVLFFDFTQVRSGYVMATLDAVATPAQPTTWGGMKALYR